MWDADLRTPSAPEIPAAARRSVVSVRSRVDFVLDVVLFAAFGIAYTFNFTGLSLHEWFGLAFGLALLVHLTLQWDWVVRTTRGLLSRSGRRRLMWAVNLLLLVDMTFCVGSGTVISAVALPMLGLHTAQGSGYWTELHVRTADAAIALIALHVGLDGRWILSVGRRMLGFRPRSPRSVGND